MGVSPRFSFLFGIAALFHFRDFRGRKVSSQISESSRIYGSLCCAAGSLRLPEYGHLTPVHGSQHLFEAALQAGMVPRPWCWVPTLVRFLGYDRVVGSSTLNSGFFGCKWMVSGWSPECDVRLSQEATKPQSGW